MSRRRKRTVSHAAADFAARARTGRKPTAIVVAGHAELFLRELAREGLAVAAECLDQIRNERLREIVETILCGTAGGALIGAAIGSAFGPAGAEVGAVVGTV